MGTKKLWGGRPRVNVAAKEFQLGYMAGLEDPGFTTATIPEKIDNPYPEGSPEHELYREGYEAAIR